MVAAFHTSFLSSAALRARWTELDHIRPYDRKQVRFENACPKSELSPPPTSRGPKTACFRGLRNVTAILTAYIFGRKYDIHNRASALTTTMDLLHHPIMSWTLVHKRLKTQTVFYPPSVHSAFCFIARLRRRRSANGTQPNFAKP